MTLSWNRGLVSTWDLVKMHTVEQMQREESRVKIPQKENFTEAGEAFLEKREPIFKGM